MNFEVDPLSLPQVLHRLKRSEGDPKYILLWKHTNKIFVKAEALLEMKEKISTYPFLKIVCKIGKKVNLDSQNKCFSKRITCNHLP